MPAPKFPVETDNDGWPLDAAPWLYGSLQLLLHLDGRPPGPAGIDMDIEVAVREIGTEFGQRLLPIAQDNQRILIISSRDAPGDFYPDRESDPLHLKATERLKGILHDTGLYVAAVEQYQIGMFEGGYPPRLPLDTWLLLLVPESEAKQTFVDEALGQLRHLEAFSSSRFGEHLTMGWDRDAGDWSVRRDHAWLFLERSISRVAEDGRSGQRSLLDRREGGSVCGVIAQPGVLAVAIGDGQSADVELLIETLSPSLRYGSADRVEDLVSRKTPGRQPDAPGPSLSNSWNSHFLHHLVHGWGPRPASVYQGARIEVLREGDLGTSDPRTTGSVRLGEQRLLLRNHT